MPAVKIVVRATGWTRVGQPELVAAGMDPAVDPARLRLYADGIEQAIQLTGNGDARFDADETLEFYAVARDTLWTDAHTYWLVTGPTTPSGKRVPLVANPAGNVAPAALPATAVMRERKVYYAPLKNGDDSNFFAAFVDGNTVTRTVPTRQVAASDGATLRLVMQGVTTGTHAVSVALNGQSLRTCGFEGQTAATCTFAPPVLVEGDNQVALVATGGSRDFSLLAAIEIDYARALLADADRLVVTAPPAAQLVLGGFSSPAVRVFDVTNPAAPVELTTGMAANPAGFYVVVNTAGATSDRTIVAVTDARVLKPASVTANRPSAWIAPLAGELVILSHERFIDAVRPLAARRAQEGWTVQLVDLQDVYDGFGAGDKTPFAIRNFLAAARAAWRIPPRFVLLVGDATADPRNFLGLGDFDFTPTKLVDTGSLETASDDWFADFDADGVPELAVGRIPARTAAEATTVVQKILRYAGAADLAQGGLFVTDPSEVGLDFQGASAAAAAKVADIMPVETLLLDGSGATAPSLLAKLGRGPFLVNYTGHGSVAVWNKGLSGGDAAALANPTLSIYVVMNCLNGLFQDLHTESLAETLLKAPNGGAVAVWASSALTSFDPQVVLNREMLARLTRTSIGEAAIAAKRAITDSDARRTWILFGDPTLFGQPAGAPATDAGTATDGGTAGDGAAPPDGGMPSDGGTPPDAGGGPPADAAARDAVGAVDVGPADAGQPGPPPEGCGCRTASHGAAGIGETVLMFLIVISARRRRQRGSSCGRGPLIRCAVSMTSRSFGSGTVPKKADGFVSRSIGDDLIIVPVRGGVGDLNAVFTLNPMGAAIWRLIDGATPVGRLAAAVAAEYEVSVDEAARDLDEFLERLMDKGILVQALEPPVNP
jgi:hypothetical protein